MGDYDSTTPLYDTFPRTWNESPRGHYPLAWAINPNLIETYPDIIDYAYRTKTNNDFFVADACGVGYCADQFGIIAQLPQIYREFGIDNCIFGRGYNFPEPKESDFYWRSEDGSEVLCEFMTYWYNNAQRFPADIQKSMAMLQFIDGNLKKTCRTGEFLLMNGVDHLEAQEDLLPILKQMNERLTDGNQIVQSTMQEFVTALSAAVQRKTLTHYTGEMRNGGAWNLLAGTLSSRIYLKQHNTLCQRMLERQLEPLYTLLAQVGAKEYPHDYLRYLWKTLLQNHPHDSICGCSVDEVHCNMMDRFSRIETGAQDMLFRGMELLSESIDCREFSQNQYLFTVFTPLQEERTQTIESVAEFPISEHVKGFKITDPNGKPVEFRVLSKEVRAKGVVTPVNLPGVVNVDAYRVLITVRKLPGLSYRTYVITPSETKTVLQPSAVCKGNILENRFLRAEIQPNGTVNLLQKETHTLLKGLFLLEDEAEIGDSYVHFDLPDCPHLTSLKSKAQITLFIDEEQRQRAEIRYLMEIPKMYCEAEKRRSEKTTELSVCLTLTLEEESRYLGASVMLENRANDHRVRMRFPTGILGSISFSGNPFDVTPRDRRNAHSENHVSDQPNSEFIAVNGERGGIALFNNGLHEYEHDKDGSILLTLLRCEGYISHDPYGEGNLVEDKWRTKESQCIGTYTLELAVYPYAGDLYSAHTAQIARCFNTPMLHCFHPVDRRKFAGGRPFVQGSDTPEFFFRAKKQKVLLPSEATFFTLEDTSGAIILSAVKQSEHDNRTILRVYNTTTHLVSFAIRLAHPGQVFRSDLRESIGFLLPQPECGKVVLQAKPKEIITLSIENTKS